MNWRRLRTEFLALMRALLPWCLSLISCLPMPHPGTIWAWRAATMAWRAGVSVDVTCRYPTMITGLWLEAHQGGSGFIVSARGAITARHVLECTALPDGRIGTVVVTTSDGHAITVEGSLPALDATVDAVRLNLATSVRLDVYPRPARRRYINGTICMMAQWPEPGIECGRVRRAGDLLMVFWIVRPGNSGAAIYDAAGDVVGLTTGRLGSLGGIGWPASAFSELWGEP